MTGEDFQDVILALSQHLGKTDSFELSPDEVTALMAGFRQLSENIGMSVSIIENLEAENEELKEQLRKRGKLWKPD